MKNILIAEDDYANCMYLTELLADSDAEVIYATNGLEAVDLCSKNTDIVLVLMDIRLPVMNGYLATKRIKELRPDMPVIAQTAYALESDMKGLKDDFDDFFLKPIPKNIFKQKLSRYVNFSKP